MIRVLDYSQLEFKYKRSSIQLLKHPKIMIIYSIFLSVTITLTLDGIDIGEMNKRNIDYMLRLERRVYRPVRKSINLRIKSTKRATARILKSISLAL